MPRETNLQLLQACLDLPLSDSELALLREISHQYALGQEADWGAANAHREPEVQALFEKLKCFII